MIGKIILHYEILEQTCLPADKVGEAHLVPQSGTAETSSIHYNGVKL